ncbi:related to DSK2 - ubiquitin-like protein [Pseudozyma flocculosa]|uniref:Related to DSK2 - ubiquitin-like protein n=1 Tax=Pseudozyma flocculosa TaxID=84751 RepID=A0A5C3F2H3_9BASI|nr:related to DSK2 - ubiquitin-like protein [Pseudozyma flocculosa]
MADASDAAADISLNVKGPSELKLSLTIPADHTVRQLKEKIEKEKPDFPADAQRLIYAGKVLKDEEPLATYKVKPGNTIHMVRSASRSAPVTGNPQNNAPPSTANANTSSSTGAASANSAQAQGVPANFAAGQNFTNNPLSALNRADLAGPHMARLLNESGGAFGQMGLNPRDPNMMLGMMQNPEVQRQMRDMMSRPEFVDQMIALNPQLQAMAPQMREMMRSEQFREMITNPESMQRMAQMSQMFGGGAGAGGLGGLGGLGGFGGAGGAGAGAGGAAQFPPPGAFGSPPSGQQQQEGGGAAAQGDGATRSAAGGANPAAPNMELLSSLLGLGAGAGAGGATGGQPPANPFAALGGLGGAGAGGQGAGASPFGDPALLQQLLGGLGGAGGGAPAAPRDSRPPEERFATQLEQMQAMGFYDGTSNVRALLMAGGSVEGAIGILLDNPNPPPTGGQ